MTATEHNRIHHVYWSATDILASDRLHDDDLVDALDRLATLCDGDVTNAQIMAGYLTEAGPWGAPLCDPCFELARHYVWSEHNSETV